jgi:pyruvate kinase
VLLTVQVSNKGDDLPTLSEWDRHVIEHWAVPNEIDFISLSFTPNARAVHECRDFAKSVGGGGVSIVAKVERLSALLHIDDIVAASDGVILSRGTLGLDMPRG